MFDKSFFRFFVKEICIFYFVNLDPEPDTDPDRVIDYGYAESGWKDLMTVYDGDSITYDAIGNPLTYRDGMTMTWEGRIEFYTKLERMFELE